MWQVQPRLLGVAVAKQLGLALIEGDNHHSADSLGKMRSGVALTDADRRRPRWLVNCSWRTAWQPDNCSSAELTCSALKRVYRDRLRRAAPGLQFVYLDIHHSQARARVTARAAQHFSSTKLVHIQLATLKVPTGEAGVLRVDATASLADLQGQVCAWLNTPQSTPKEAA